jgi:Zn finger protein HypA/HybF involved in hydrogenase expression
VHESSLTTWLVRRVEAAAEEQKASRVTRVAVRIGALSSVSAAHLSEHFTRAATSSAVAKGAKLDVTVSTDVSDPSAGGLVLEGVEMES